MTDLRTWLNERPALNISVLAKEAGINKSTLDKFAKGLRNLPEGHEEKLIKVLKKYGYK